MPSNPEIVNRQIQICPFWRQVAVVENASGQRRIVALCGKESPYREKLPEMLDLGPRLEKCPFSFSPEGAYYQPVIMVVNPDTGRQQIIVNGPEGKAGINKLRKVWDEVVGRVRSSDGQWPTYCNDLLEHD